jgi:hypothetical protein
LVGLEDGGPVELRPGFTIRSWECTSTQGLHYLVDEVVCGLLSFLRWPAEKEKITGVHPAGSLSQSSKTPERGGRGKT